MTQVTESKETYKESRGQGFDQVELIQSRWPLGIV